jgi:hypothetical protein
VYETPTSHRPSALDKRLIGVMVVLHSRLPRVVDELLACTLVDADRLVLADQLERVVADLRAERMSDVGGDSRMSGALFMLTVNENADRVHAWGMELTFDDPDTQEENRVALVYVPGARDERSTQSTHASAERARRCYSRALLLDLEVAWVTG